MKFAKGWQIYFHYSIIYLPNLKYILHLEKCFKWLRTWSLYIEVSVLIYLCDIGINARCRDIIPFRFCYSSKIHLKTGFTIVHLSFTAWQNESYIISKTKLRLLKLRCGQGESRIRCVCIFLQEHQGRKKGRLRNLWYAQK